MATVEQHPPTVDAPLLDAILELDATLLSVSSEEANVKAEELIRELKSRCTVDSDSFQQARCHLGVILGNGVLAPKLSRQSAEDSTIAVALRSGRGSCAALVAAVLALTAPVGDPFEAVVLRQHVVLGLREAPGAYFEVLERGRRLIEDELDRIPAQPGGPLELRGTRYLAYYADNIAARLADAGRDQAAEAAFSKALELDADAARVHFNFGSFLYARDSYAAALDHLTRAIELGWDDADAYVNRGATLWRLNRLREARADFEGALALDPDNHRARANLKRILSRGKE